jgi:hypothetical protein
MNTNLSIVVDALGEVRAKIAEYRNQELMLENVLKSGGAGAYDGLYFRATVSEFERASVAWKEIALKLEPSPQLKAAHTTKSTVVAINVTARSAEKAAA